MSLEGRILTLVKELEEEKRLADKRAKQLYLAGASFIGHDDTPAAYAGGAGKFVKVNATPDALIFADIAWGDVSKAGSNLTDLATRQHAGLTNITSDQHHPQAHSLASHSTKAHSELTGVTSDQHHAAAHSHAHASITSVTANQHHAQVHALTTHSDFSTYLNQAVKTTSSPTHVNMNLTGGLTSAAGQINYIHGIIDSIGTYNNETTNPSNMRCLSNGQFKVYYSSQRFKDNITDLEVDSALIYKLRPVSFNSKCKGDNKDRRFHGLIAEEVERVAPELVDYSEEGEADNYSSPALIALILAETQRHEARIKVLEEQLNN